MSKSISYPARVLMAISLWLAACGQAGGPPATSAVPPSVTGSAEGAPEGCGTAEVTARLQGLFDAINRADPDVVDEFFGEARYASFEWYSMGGPNEGSAQNYTAYNFADLRAYWEARYAQHEWLELHSIQFNGWEAQRGLVHFGPVELRRQADDVRLGTGEGKGAYECAREAFVVLSFAMQ